MINGINVLVFLLLGFVIILGNVDVSGKSINIFFGG